MPSSLPLLDPFGNRALDQVTRYWSVLEQNTLLPSGDRPVDVEPLVMARDRRCHLRDRLRALLVHRAQK